MSLYTSERRVSGQWEAAKYDYGLIVGWRVQQLPDAALTP